MELSKILEKTKDKVKNTTITRKPPVIATEDRPYSILEISSNLIIEQTKNNLEETLKKPETNQRQTGDKPETNQRQTRDKLKTNLKKPETNQRQTRVQSEDAFRDKPETNQRQSEDDSENLHSFSNLVGIQKKIALMFYYDCQKNRTEITQKYTVEAIAKTCETTVKSAKKSIQRIEQKNIIERVFFKNGRGGWTQYKLSKHIYNEILNNEVLYNRENQNQRQTRDKLETKLETKVETMPLSSSSNYINNKTTTTGELEKFALIPEEWEKINFECLANIGFGYTQIKQLYGLNVSNPEIIQTSINHFAFSLEHNEKAKSYSSPLNVLMGVLRKGQVWFEPSYRSPQEIALEAILKAKTEEIERLKALEEKCHKLAFSEWSNSLSEEDKKSITSKHKMIPAEVALRLYFTENVWDQKKSEYGIKTHN